MSTDLAPTAAAVQRVIAGVRDDQLGGPTPCDGTSVAAMLDHFAGLTVAFRLGAEKRPQEGPPRADAGRLPPDWRERLPGQLDELVAAWQQPSAWEGITEVGGAKLPAAAMGVIALNEVLVHGWDLAVAIGAPYEVDEAAAQRCLQFARELAAGAPEVRNGMFGPEVPVPDDASTFDRLLGATGREPGWRP